MEAERDDEAWHGVLDGDASRFGVIWDRHRDRVFHHLLKAGVPATDAEDLTATVFLEAWRRRSEVRFVAGSLLPWLIVTATNVARNATRARNRYRAFLAKLPPPLPVLDPADQVADRNGPVTARVRQAMDDSSAIDRQLLALTVIEQFTLREAAVVLGISESAAKMRLSRLRARLRASLTEPPVVKEVL